MNGNEESNETEEDIARQRWRNLEGDYRQTQPYDTYPNNRTGRAYLGFIFVDDIDPRLYTEDNKKPIAQLSSTVPISYHGLDTEDFHPDTRSLEEIGKIFGGREEFFKPGSVILDIGSGNGTAADDLSKEFTACKFNTVDITYPKKSPRTKTNRRTNLAHVRASWVNIPFVNSTFDRLISTEAFPRYPFSGGNIYHTTEQNLEHVLNTFKEISRVAKPGALWRGSYSDQAKVGEAVVDSKFIVEQLIENGWEVYIIPLSENSGGGYVFIARLVNKKSY